MTTRWACDSGGLVGLLIDCPLLQSGKRFAAASHGWALQTLSDNLMKVSLSAILPRYYNHGISTLNVPSCCVPVPDWWSVYRRDDASSEEGNPLTLFSVWTGFRTPTSGFCGGTDALKTMRCRANMFSPVRSFDSLIQWRELVCGRIRWKGHSVPSYQWESVYGYHSLVFEEVLTKIEIPRYGVWGIYCTSAVTIRLICIKVDSDLSHPTTAILSKVKYRKAERLVMTERAVYAIRIRQPVRQRTRAECL